MKQFLFIASLATLAGSAMAQSSKLFDDGWRFALNSDSMAYTTKYDDSKWRTLDLPHDWSVEGKFAKENPSGGEGGYLPTGEAWYRKTFSLPKTKDAKNLSLYFEGVYMNSTVYVNGIKVGGHPYGYSAFSVDITDAVKWGAKNVVAVHVDNSKQTNCRWYSGSGIYRHVRLIETAPTHFEQWGIGITTPEVSQTAATVNINAKIASATSSEKLTIKTTILDDKGVTVNSSTTECQGNSKDIKVKVQQPHLWSPESPYIYKAKVELCDANGKLLDSRTEEFGIRTIEFSAKEGFKLNGKPMLLNGGCAHHDNGVLGAAAFDRAEWRKVELMKQGGFNAVRTSHNVPSEEFLRACDHLGLLVIDEAFDGWRDEKKPYDYHTLIDEWWEKDVDAMVLRDRNHPSIICWSNGNEVIERKKLEVVKTSKKLADRMRMLDPTRPVTQALAAWDRDWDIYDPLAATLDITGYNYMIHMAESDHKRVPERVMWQTESYPRDAYRNWKTVVDHPYVIGDFVWTAIDYLGESSIGAYHYEGENRNESWIGDHYPWHGAYCGDIDITGWRKPISHYRDMLYNSYGKSEKIYMGVKEPDGYTRGKLSETMWSVWPTWESWNWKGHEGKPIDVVVYSRYDKVRLYLNDKVVGTASRDVKNEPTATHVFTVSYAPGTLKAVGIDANGKEDTENAQIIKTSDKPAGIRVKTTSTDLKANGQDLCFIEVEVVDKDGNVCPDADNEISFSITGNATIQASGNANLQDETSYSEPKRKVWKGRAIVVVRSSHKAGKATLTIKGEGLKTAQCSILMHNS